ncbi:MAG: hypothetical protein V1722_00010 [Candidatus Micrarchaeota archaeon]
MLKKTLRGGDILGTVHFNHLPSDIREHVNVFTDSRFGKVAIPVTGAAVGAGVGALGGSVKSTLVGAAFGAAAGIAATSRWNELALHGMAVAVRKTSNPAIRGFIELGATHFGVGRNGHLFFVKAPAKLKEKPFRPIVGRAREPI